jgi:hypothetical protein
MAEYAEQLNNLGEVRQRPELYIGILGNGSNPDDASTLF